MDDLALADGKEEEALAMGTLAFLENKECKEEHKPQFILYTNCPYAPGYNPMGPPKHVIRIVSRS